MSRILLRGAMLTAVATTLLVAQFGRAALVPGMVFGALATAIQVGAGHAMRGSEAMTTTELLKRHGIGMALRLGGVVVLVLAILLWRELFAPLPTALGFVGVLIPLLFLEARLAR